MPKYIVQFAHFHEDFRLAELESLATLEGVEISYDPSTYDTMSPFLVIEVASDELAAKLVRRAILLRRIVEYWGSGTTYDELFAEVKQTPERWADYHQSSFKFTVGGFGKSLTTKEQISVIESFSFLGFEGKIEMRNPDVEFAVLEDYGESATQTNPAAVPKKIWFGRIIASGSRDLVSKYDLKKRKYLGNTSMDAELSLVMANQALARPGALVYDPFVGTGSFLLTCSHFGALSMGSDIDGRQIRGTAGFRRGVDGISANLKQYNLADKVVDTLVFDICRNPWRKGAKFDAIVTDPPYGVRAGAKRLGRKDGTVAENSFKIIDGVENYKRENYYPPTVPYEMAEVITDLLNFAAENLVVGGRLVYWLPTVADEYDPKDIPQHEVFRLVANSEQPFGGWSRRLVTMEKVREIDESTESTPAPEHAPAHMRFRDRYFSKFEPMASK
ncbi:hypothetical protein EC988_002000 [Linderina pennispora]|nr:hypothetical protein EC988_002000 [Linderina pennispora]